MTQLADYRTAVQLRGYDNYTPSLIDGAIQEARRRVVGDYRWSFLETENATLTTTPSVATVSLASITDLLHVDAVKLADANGNPLPLEWLPVEDVRRRQQNWIEVGEPFYWTRRAGKLIFYPTPDQQYELTVEYVQDPGELEDATTDVIPAAQKDLVVWAAVVPLAVRNGDLQQATASDQMYSTLMRRQSAEDAREQRQTPRRVNTGYWGC